MNNSFRNFLLIGLLIAGLAITFIVEAVGDFTHDQCVRGDNYECVKP